LLVCLFVWLLLSTETDAYVSVLHQFCVQAVTKVRMHFGKIIHLKNKDINDSSICSSVNCSCKYSSEDEKFLKVSIFSCTGEKNAAKPVNHTPHFLF